MPTTYREGKLSGLNTAIGNVGKVYLQKMLQEQEQKRKIKQALEQTVLEAALKDQRLKPGADLSALDTSQGMQGILGQIPGMFERAPDIEQELKSARLGRFKKQIENERRMSVLGGLEEPSIEDIGRFMPLYGEGGPAAGISASGQPTPEALQSTVGAMRQKFSGKIPVEDLRRKAMGIPFTGRATQAQIVSLAKSLAEAKNPMPTAEDIQAKLPEAQKIFSGQAMNTQSEEISPETQDLIDEYQTTTDPERIKQLEDILTSLGVEIQ